MKLYRRGWLAVVSALAFIVIATGLVTPESFGAVLQMDIAWYDGFTAHAVGIASAGLAIPEAVAEAAKALRDEITTIGKDIGEKLQKNLTEQVGSLESRIKAGETAGLGVAELKEQSAKMSEDNARFVRDIEAKVKTFADELNTKFDKAQGTRPGRIEVVDFGAGLAEAVKAAKMGSADFGRRARFEFKRFPSSQKDISVSGDTVYAPAYVPGIIGPGQRALRVRDLLPQNRTANNTVYFTSETSLTDNAGMQSALGAAKGESTFTVTVDSESVKTLAHFIQVPVQILDDLDALADYVNARMLFMLDQYEEDQLLYGNDTGQELNGLMTQATAFDTSLLTEFGVSASGDTDIDIIRAAIAQCQVAQFPPTAIVMHTYNWAAIELAKDAEYRYIFASPFNLATPRMWGLPVVATTAMTSPDFLVGAFGLGAAIWDRQQSSLAISTEDSDNFQKNLATIRAEKRMTLTVFRPASFIEGNFGNTIT